MSLDQLSDGQLLDTFVQTQRHDAFTALVDRHQALVLSVCRRWTHHQHDAEDAAQRVFLTLARKAPTLRKRDSLAGWLFLTARQVSQELHRANQRRQRREAMVMASSPAAHADEPSNEWREVLDQHLADLPSKYREPIVLHHLQGVPRKQAAQRMGLAEGAFAMRLQRGRQMLHDGMTRAGLTFSASALASLSLATDDGQASPRLLDSYPDLCSQAVLELEKSAMMTGRFKQLAVLTLSFLGLAGAAFAWTQSKQPAQPAVKVTPKDLDRQVVGNNHFARDLFPHLQKDAKAKSFVYSPYSISTVTAMAYAGANAQTASEIAKALHFEFKPNQLPYISTQLSRGLLARAEKSKQELNIANGMIMIKPLQIRQDYQNTVVHQFDGEIVEGDNPLKMVNNWVNEKTKGHIKSILKELPGDMICVLVNAIYFKSNWKHAFEKSNTKPATFHVSDQKALSVSMMSQKNEFRYLKQDDVEAVVFPYQGDQFNMVCVMPGKSSKLEELQKKFAEGKMDETFKKLDSQELSDLAVQLPKFRLSSQFDLKPIYKTLGIEKAFNTRANFSGMSTTQVWISKIIHKAYIEVNETGTKAAAVTVIGPVSGSEPTRIAFNRPFLFVIRDQTTGSILFAGQVIEPSDQN